MFTESKYALEKIESLVAEKSAALKVNAGMSDLAGYGVGVISRRLAKDPLRYRDYGPYWWAVKRMMAAADHAMGEQFDPVVAAEYVGRADSETLVMAEMFRDENLMTRPVGSNVFTLAEGSDYILFDSDMETRLAKMLPTKP